MGIPEWLEGMLKDGKYRSVYDMALKIGVPPPTVYRWLKGQACPSIPYCIKLARATGTPLEDVIHMAGDGEVVPDAAEEETIAKLT